MEDNEILQHLISLEKEASSLVYDAQAEADRKISEGENENRLRFEERYAEEAELLEKNYREIILSLKNKYKLELEQYGESLKNQPVNFQAFSELAERLLIEK